MDSQWRRSREALPCALLHAPDARAVCVRASVPAEHEPRFPGQGTTPSQRRTGGVRGTADASMYNALTPCIAGLVTPSMTYTSMFSSIGEFEAMNMDGSKESVRSSCRGLLRAPGKCGSEPMTRVVPAASGWQCRILLASWKHTSQGKFYDVGAPLRRRAVAGICARVRVWKLQQRRRRARLRSRSRRRRCSTGARFTGASDSVPNMRCVCVCVRVHLRQYRACECKRGSLIVMLQNPMFTKCVTNAGPHVRCHRQATADSQFLVWRHVRAVGRTRTCWLKNVKYNAAVQARARRLLVD